MSKPIGLGVKAILVGWASSAIFYASAAVIPRDTVISAEAITGSDEFYFSCASCHGVEGRGDGLLASILNVKPTDLTALARNNNGQFPVLRVARMIDGRESFYAHGDRAMPVWGIRYLLEHAVKYGGAGGEKAVEGRIRKLVEYLQSIQE